MTSTFTPNKNIQMPASGDFSNAWASPVNLNFLEIDTAFGGTTSISVTGVAGPSVALTLSQYQPPNIEFSGVLEANLEYYLPAGVGGIWTVENNTSGAFTLTFGILSSGVILPQGVSRSLIVSDGSGVQLADSATAAAAQANAEAFATSAANTAQSNAETYAAAQAASALASANAHSAIASNITSGTVANARLPFPGVGPGVTIAADPGTTPTGPAGSIWYYY